MDEEGPNVIPLAPVDEGKKAVDGWWCEVEAGAGTMHSRGHVYLDTELFKRRCGASTMHTRGHVYLGYAGNGGCYKWTKATRV